MKITDDILEVKKFIVKTKSYAQLTNYNLCFLLDNSLMLEYYVNTLHFYKERDNNFGLD